MSRVFIEVKEEKSFDVLSYFIQDYLKLGYTQQLKEDEIKEWGNKDRLPTTPFLTLLTVKWLRVMTVP